LLHAFGAVGGVAMRGTVFGGVPCCESPSDGISPSVSSCNIFCVIKDKSCVMISQEFHNQLVCVHLDHQHRLDIASTPQHCQQLELQQSPGLLGNASAGARLPRHPSMHSSQEICTERSVGYWNV
jgi:hypothetical protein